MMGLSYESNPSIMGLLVALLGMHAQGHVLARVSLDVSSRASSRV